MPVLLHGLPGKVHVYNAAIDLDHPVLQAGRDPQLLFSFEDQRRPVNHRYPALECLLNHAQSRGHSTQGRDVL